MRTWKIAPSLMACGKCIGWIAKGQPVQFVHIQGLRSPKVRCVACAEGQPPEGLAVGQDAPRIDSGAGMEAVGSVAQRFDWRMASSRGDDQ